MTIDTAVGGRATIHHRHHTAAAHGMRFDAMAEVGAALQDCF